MRDKDFEITNVIIRSNLCCVLSVASAKQDRVTEGEKGERGRVREEREEIRRKGERAERGEWGGRR